MILKFLSFLSLQKTHKYTEFRRTIKVKEVIKLQFCCQKNPQKFEDLYLFNGFEWN